MTDPRRVQAITDRIRYAARSRNIDPHRLRRSLAFQRFLVRVAPHGLVLKGGFCLEARLGLTARATKDLDLVGALGAAADPDAVLDVLEGLFDSELVDDGFAFRCAMPKRLRSPDVEHDAWRVTVEAVLDGRLFQTFVVDLVGQVAEVEGGTETLLVASPLTVTGLEPVAIRAVDVHQHAAEKFHAYSRVYARELPSSRDKDLVDLVLLIEAGLLDDCKAVGERLAVVWRLRESAPPPAELPTPPVAWAEPYAAKAAELDLSARTLDAAYQLVADLYAAARPTEGNHS